MSLIFLTFREATYRFNARVLIIIVSEEGEFKALKGCPNCKAGCKLLGLGARPDIRP